MIANSKIKVLFIAGFGPIVRDQKRSEKFYVETLGLPFNREEGGYLHPEGILIGVTLTPSLRKK